MKRRPFFLFFIVWLVFSCNADQRKNTTIEIDAPLLTGQKIYLSELLIHESQAVDSTEIVQNMHAFFKLDLEQAGFYFLHNEFDEQILLQVNPGEQIMVSIHDKNLKGYTLKGSEGSSIIHNYQKFRDRQKARIDSLGQILIAHKGMDDFLSVKEETDQTFDEIFEQFREYVISEIETHPGSLASLILINGMVERMSVLDEIDDFYLFHKTDSLLGEKYPENKHVLDHAERVKKIRLEIYDDFLASEKLAPGRKAPKVVMKDVQGDFISLSDLKGSAVLLYFWSAWDEISREIHKKIKIEYPQMQAAGMKVFGVSMIENKNVWKSAVTMDSTPWIQGSDLKGVLSPVYKKYNLKNHIPCFYLINDKGKIVARSEDIDEILVNIKQFINHDN